MYEEFFGFLERPFDLTSDPKYLLLTRQHTEALSNLEYGIFAGNGGIVLLLGEAGAGKTTLLRKVLGQHVQHAHEQRQAREAARWAFLTNPKLTPNEFLDSVGHAFQVRPKAAASKSTFLRELELNLAEHRQRGIVNVLVVDEAQSLSDELLEELRLLANIELGEKLLCVVLAAQPVFGERLNEPRLRQLKQRIGLRCTLPVLDLHATASYIAHRITLAGGNPARTFSRDAVIAIYERSQGIPRTINVICDNALLTGFAADQRPVGAAIVLEVCRDFDFDTAAVLPARPERVPDQDAGQRPECRGQEVSASFQELAASVGRLSSLAWRRR
jgi:general secretion pathway protein A